MIAYGAVFALGGIIPLVGNRLLLQRHLHGPRPPADPEVWRMLIRAGIPLMALTFFNLIYGTIDLPILDFISGDEPVGWLALAYRWVGIPLFMATAVVAAYFPRFSAHGKAQTEEFPRLVNRAIRLVLLVSVPAALGLALVADDLIATIYDVQYEPTVPLIQILALQIPIAALDTILATALIASDRHHKYLWVAASAAVLHPVACVVLIHWAEPQLRQRRHRRGHRDVRHRALRDDGSNTPQVAGGAGQSGDRSIVVRIVAASMVLVPLLTRRR